MEMLQFTNYEKFDREWEVFFFVGLASTLFFGSIVLPFIYRRYLSVRYKRAFHISFIALFVAYLFEYHYCVTRWDLCGSFHENPVNWFHHCLTPGLLVLFGVPFVYKLIAKWFYKQTSEEEKTPGAIGYRAWLHPANLVCVVVIAYAYTASYNFWNWNREILKEPYEFFFVLLAWGVGLLAAYPTILLMHKHKSELAEKAEAKRKARAAGQEDQSAVQSKILDLLANGKITPQECADLLAAVLKPKDAKQTTDVPPKSSLQQECSPPPAPSVEPPTIHEAEGQQATDGGNDSLEFAPER